MDDHRSNPLDMPDFAPLASTFAEIPRLQPLTKGMQEQEIRADVPAGAKTGGEEITSLVFGYSSLADEQDYMTFRYQWGRLAATSAFCACGVCFLAIPLTLDHRNWFNWWSYYAMIVISVLLFVVAAINAIIIFAVRKEARLTLKAARLYEACIVAGGCMLCVVSALYYYNTMMCAQDKLSLRQDPFGCISRIPITTLACTVIFSCGVPCRVVIAVVIGSVIAPLATFIVRLANPMDSDSELATKLIVTLVITGAFTFLCIKRDLAHRKRYQIERVISAGNVKMAATQTLVVDTLETVFPPGLVGRLVRGMTVVSTSSHVAVGGCDIGDLSTLSRFFSPLQIITHLNELTNAFDASVRRGGGEKLKTFGDRFAFTVGLLSPAPISPTEAVHSAINIAYSFSRKQANHPAVLALAACWTTSSFAHRSCIGFGACTGGIVGISFMSYEAFSPALTEIDSILPDCPINVVVMTDAAAAHCPSLTAVEPLLTVTVAPFSRGTTVEPERQVALFPAPRPQSRTAPAVASPLQNITSPGLANIHLASSNLNHSGVSMGEISVTSCVPPAGDFGVTERRRQAELADAIFRWGSELQLQTPQFDDPIELVKDAMLDRALEIIRSDSRQSTLSPNILTLDDSTQPNDVGASGQMLPSGASRLIAQVEGLLSANKKTSSSSRDGGPQQRAGNIGDGILVPRRYRSAQLEDLFDGFERTFVVNNAFVLVCIVGVFFAALLVVVLAVGGRETHRSPTIPLLCAGIVLCAVLAVLLRFLKARLRECTFSSYFMLLLTTVMMAFSFASVKCSKMPVLAENTTFVLILHMGLISSCTTRFSHALLLNLINAAGHIFVMWNSHDFGLLLVIVYAVISFACAFPPLEVERGLRSSFELALIASALRRGLRGDLAIASAILHRTLPRFLASRVLDHGQTIIEKSTMIPNVFVMAMRIDGYSRTVCDGMQHVQCTSITLVDEFLCAVELCIANAVKMSLALEEGISKGPHADAADVLVKVSAFGDKMMLFGPLVDRVMVTDRELRTAARAMLHVIEHLSSVVVPRHFPRSAATSIATFDSGLLAIVGKSRCMPNIMGVAARQADLLLRAAPDGYNGVVSSFVKAATLLELNLPVAQGGWIVSEHGESWRVRGAGAVTVHRLHPGNT